MPVPVVTEPRKVRPIPPVIVIPGFSDSLRVSAVPVAVKGKKPEILLRLQCARDPVALDMTIPLESFRKLEGFIKSVDEWRQRP